MTLEGDLQRIELPQVLHQLAAKRQTGILTIQGEDDIVAVSFLGGQIVAADALNQTVEEGLGQVLVDRQMIGSEAFEAASRDHKGGGEGSLGDALVSKGLLTREQLLEGLRIQTYGLMLEVMTWRQGEFKFYGGDEVSYEDGFTPLSVEELLIRAIEDLQGEEAALEGSVPTLEAVYRRIPPRHLVQVLGRDGDGSEGGVWVTEAEWGFLAEVDGRQTAGAIAQRRRMGRYEALYALYRLLRFALLERTTAQASAPAVGTSSAPSIPFQGTPRVAGFEVESPAAPAPVVMPRPSSVAALLEEVEEGAEVAAWYPWLPRLLGIFLVVAVAILLFRPVWLLLPFPWQESQRAGLQRQLRQSRYQKIDRAARTFFLMEAHYPDSLDELVEGGLLAPTDRQDPTGHPLAYSAGDITYRIAPVVEGEEVAALGRTDGITGDFYLDPQFLAVASSAEAPLYLID